MKAPALEPLISILIPCLNEEQFILALLQWVEKDCQHPYEVLVIDGGSSDRTQELVKEFSRHNVHVQLINNPGKYVPQAINAGIALARGRYIARLDAHAIYPDHYFDTCLKVLEKTKADNAGGYHFFGGSSKLQLAIANALSSYFGIGYISGNTDMYDHYTDSVHSGFWPRSTFDKYGIFDTELIRDQDEEFNYRIVKQGGRIYKSAEIKIMLTVRNTYSLLATQYFQYGFYKPLMIKKHGRVRKMRHLIPSAFILYLLLLLLLPSLQLIMCIPLYTYMLLCFIFAIPNNLGIVNIILTALAFPVIHLSYGTGFIAGLFRAIKN